MTFTVYPDMFHDFQMMASLVPAGMEAVAEMVAYLERQLVRALPRSRDSTASSGGTG